MEERNELAFVKDDGPHDGFVKVRYNFATEEQAKKAQEMANLLRRKYPNMKPQRIARKIADYFHLKPATTL